MSPLKFPWSEVPYWMRWLQVLLLGLAQFLTHLGMFYFEKGVIWLIQNVYQSGPFKQGGTCSLLIDKILRKCIFSPLQCNTMNVLLGHTAHFYQPMRPQAQEAKVERLERMKRSRSVPKLNQEGIEVLVSQTNYSQSRADFC